MVRHPPPSRTPRSTPPPASGIANTFRAVAYALGIYLLNLFLAFLTPKFDPVSDAADQDMEDGSAGGLPTKNDDEFKPFIRRLPEFKFWYWATRAVTIAFMCSWFAVFDVPVFWPVLVMYWFILFFLTSKSHPRAGAVYLGSECRLLTEGAGQ